MKTLTKMSSLGKIFQFSLASNDTEKVNNEPKGWLKCRFLSSTPTD